jgi:hypothetical protein
VLSFYFQSARLLTAVSARVLVPSVFCFLRQQHREASAFWNINSGAHFCSPSTPTLVPLSACYTRNGAKIGRLTLASLFWLPLQRCCIYFAGAGQPVLAPFYSAGASVALAHPLRWLAPFTALASSTRQRPRSLFWPPPQRQRLSHPSAIVTPALEEPVLAPFSAPASGLRQRTPHASVREAYSGSLLNASV